MTSNYIFLALCLVLTQIPGFLTKPSDFDGYGDERRWGGEPRAEMTSYYSPKAMHASFDNNFKLGGKKKHFGKQQTNLLTESMVQKEKSPKKKDKPMKAIGWFYWYYPDEDFD